jgi:hypothetical protein
MAEDDVGYGKPPKASQFKPGVSGNPKGRPRRAPQPLAEAIRAVLSAPMQYREAGRIKSVSRHELSLMMLVERAVTGDVAAAELILRTRAQALRIGDFAAEKLLIHDWLPDYPGQTGAEKTKQFAERGEAEPQAWWKDEG